MASPVDEDVRADAPPKISEKAGHMEGVMEKVVEAFSRPSS
jgi:hypothetical protein